jgi:hypothetical protein
MAIISDVSASRPQHPTSNYLSPAPYASASAVVVLAIPRSRARPQLGKSVEIPAASSLV